MVEAVFVEIEKDGIADGVAVFVAGDELFRLVDFEGFETVDAEIRKEFECVGTFDIKVGHVMRLIEKSAGFPPGTLLVSPVCELVANNGKRIRSYLRIS